MEQALKGNAVLGIAQALQALAPGEKIDLVGTGSLTNLALFAKVFPQLLLDKVERIILMGGAEGRGNKSPVAESNILCDAHAAAIVFDLNLPVVICVRCVVVLHRRCDRNSDDRVRSSWRVIHSPST